MPSSPKTKEDPDGDMLCWSGASPRSWWKMTVQTLGSYYLVERPIMRLRDRKKLAPAAPAVVAAP
jgi:hypothetical protein